MSRAVLYEEHLPQKLLIHGLYAEVALGSCLPCKRYCRAADRAVACRASVTLRVASHENMELFLSSVMAFKKYSIQNNFTLHWCIQTSPFVPRSTVSKIITTDDWYTGCFQFKMFSTSVEMHCSTNLRIKLGMSVMLNHAYAWSDTWSNLFFNENCKDALDYNFYCNMLDAVGFG